jgi:hypothetical protein
LIVKVKIVSTRSVATFGQFLLFNCNSDSGGGSWLFYWWYGGIGKSSGDGSFARLRKVIWEGVVLVDKEVAVV